MKKKTLLKSSHLFCVTAVLALLSMFGCSSTDSVNAVSTPVDLGVRATPMGTIKVVKISNATDPALKCALTITDASIPPVKMEARVGTEYDASAPMTEAMPLESESNTFEWTAPIAQSLVAGSHVWIRATWDDGTVVESGLEDFVL